MHDLTGTHSVFTQWRGIEIMFHVSTLLPFEQNDPQKVSEGGKSVGLGMMPFGFQTATGYLF